MFFYKIHKSGGKVVLAACDSGLAGKKFSEGNVILDIRKDFYCEKETGDEIIKIFPQADIINLVGKNIVGLAIKNGWVSGGAVIRIKRIPHAQVFVL